MLSGKASEQSEFNANRVNSDSKLKLDDDANISKNSFNKSKRRIRFNSFSSSSNPLYKRDNSSLFRNYFNDSYEKFVTEDDNEIGTEEDTITLNKSPIKNNTSDDHSITLNISKDKMLFNNIQYDSFFIHDIDPFKETINSQKNYNNNNGFTGNILDELKEDEKKDDKYIENSMINPNYYSERPPSYCFDSPKKESIRFNNSPKKESVRFNDSPKKESVRFNEEQLNPKKY